MTVLPGGRLPAAIACGLLAWTAGVSAQTAISVTPPGITVVWNTPAPAPPAPAPTPPSTPGHGPSHQPTGPVAGDQFLADPGTYAPRYQRQRQRGRLRAFTPYGYVPGPGAYVPYVVGPPPIPVPSREVDLEAAATGRLALDVTPGTTQVFVDGFYEGTVDDFRDRGLWLETGPHHVELRAEGFDTVTFHARIVEGGTVDYRAAMTRATERREPARTAGVAKSFYVIRGCYAGDTPPSAARLPEGCRAEDVRVIPPRIGP